MSESNQNVTNTAVIESSVKDRYAKGSEQVEPALCCPITNYDQDYLKVLPEEIIEKDYGCGDPSQYVKAGDVAIDLGSGAGKICYIMSQIVGEKGRVIGVDFNPPMLALARKYQTEITGKIGYDNVQFVMGKIQDMKLDYEQVEGYLAEHPVESVEGHEAFEAYCKNLRAESPLIDDETADVVVSNCVLNLVLPEQKKQLFKEILRVLKVGGRAVISDIVCDEEPTGATRNDPHLWSGCIAGAFLEDEFLEMFEAAGFVGVEILGRQEEPWQTIDGVEFRSMTVRAWKPDPAKCIDRHHAVVYQGPWKRVVDENGASYERGKRMAVCDKTYRMLTRCDGAYGGEFLGIEPYTAVPENEAKVFDCSVGKLRDPKVTKGEGYRETKQIEGDACCGPKDEGELSDGCCG